MRTQAPGVRWLYKWLPIVFGCHCKPERSFFVRGVQLPLCARCTGILVGMVLFGTTAWFVTPPAQVLLLLCIPLVVDGCVQLATSYESRNIRRLATGILFGYAIVGIAWALLVSGFRFGRELGSMWKVCWSYR